MLLFYMLVKVRTWRRHSWVHWTHSHACLHLSLRKRETFFGGCIWRRGLKRKKRRGEKKAVECEREPSPCARFHGARAARDRSGSVEEEEEEAGQRCWSCGNDGAERGDDTSLILYKVGPMRGQISAANAMKNIRGKKLLLLSPVADAFLAFSCGLFSFPSHPVSGAHLKRSHTMSGS